jgi:hypothetical protein
MRSRTSNGFQISTDCRHVSLSFKISVGITSSVVFTQYLQVSLKAAITWTKSAVNAYDFLLLNIQYDFRSADASFIPQPVHFRRLHVNVYAWAVLFSNMYSAFEPDRLSEPCNPLLYNAHCTHRFIGCYSTVLI